ncbi:MAG TPA: cytochrome c peroxidase [Chitinophagaceae bacterium]|nr:cytochrome c peroxidase [Chitinophagaceae bacterium]
MKKTITILTMLFFVSGIIIFEACNKKDVVQPAQTTPLSIPIPPGFPAIQNFFVNNPITQEGFDLGKKLFYDGRLSVDGNFPCASCHQQFAAFATFDHNLSHGFGDQFTTRNAPGLANLAWYKEFHWDGGINHLEVQPLAPITAPNEMAETIENVVRKLKADATYQEMFRKAFASNEITSQQMLRALAQFMGMMVSANSKYDRVKAGKETFTAAEQRGYQLFSQKCSTCHQEPLFTDQSYRNTGLPIDNVLKDMGRMRITKKSEDSIKFKVPTLRNVYLTAPYGHDGRFYSIGAVIDHYRSGVINGPTTDPLLKNKLSIDDFEKADLLIFLRTLTDTSFVNDKRFAQN